MKFAFLYFLIATNSLNVSAKTPEFRRFGDALPKEISIASDEPTLELIDFNPVSSEIAYRIRYKVPILDDESGAYAFPVNCPVHANPDSIKPDLRDGGLILGVFSMEQQKTLDAIEIYKGVWESKNCLTLNRVNANVSAAQKILQKHGFKSVAVGNGPDFYNRTRINKLGTWQDSRTLFFFVFPDKTHKLLEWNAANSGVDSAMAKLCGESMVDNPDYQKNCGWDPGKESFYSPEQIPIKGGSKRFSRIYSFSGMAVSLILKPRTVYEIDKRYLSSAFLERSGADGSLPQFEPYFFEL